MPGTAITNIHSPSSAGACCNSSLVGLLPAWRVCFLCSLLHDALVLVVRTSITVIVQRNMIGIVRSCADQLEIALNQLRAGVDSLEQDGCVLFPAAAGKTVPALFRICRS
jgi:hypothetical protein